MSLRVLICDRLPIMRDGLRIGLQSEADIQVVGMTDSGMEALIMARTARPDVIVVDPALSGLSGIDLVRRLDDKTVTPNPKILVFSLEEDDLTVIRLLECGAMGFLIKGASVAELAVAIRTIHAGDPARAPSVTPRMLDWYFRRAPRPGQPLPAQISGLTTRERQVLQLIARGLATREVAEELRVGEATVRTHTYRMQHKLQLRNRTQLMSFAYRCGLAPGDLGRPRRQHVTSAGGIEDEGEFQDGTDSQAGANRPDATRCGSGPRRRDRGLGCHFSGGAERGGKNSGVRLPVLAFWHRRSADGGRPAAAGGPSGASR